MVIMTKIDNRYYKAFCQDIFMAINVMHNAKMIPDELHESLHMSTEELDSFFRSLPDKIEV